MCFSFCQCQILRSHFCINFPPFFSCCFLSRVQKALKACRFSVPFCGTTSFMSKSHKHLCWRCKYNPLLLAGYFLLVGLAPGVTAHKASKIDANIKNIQWIKILIYSLFLCAWLSSVFPKPRWNGTKLMLNGDFTGTRCGLIRYFRVSGILFL